MRLFFGTDDTRLIPQLVPLACGLGLLVRVSLERVPPGSTHRDKSVFIPFWKQVFNPAPPLPTWLATTLPLPPQAVAVLRSKTLRSFTDITHATRTSRPNSQDETHRLPTVTPYPFRDLDITAFVKGTLVNPSLGDAPLSYVGILNLKVL